jgi:hypothetical protein
MPSKNLLPRRRLLTAVAALSVAAAGCRQVERPLDRQVVIDAAHDVVMHRLASPGQVAFGGEVDITVENLGGNRYRVTGPLDYEGETGGMRSTFACVLHYRGKEWELEDLTIQ